MLPLVRGGLLAVALLLATSGSASAQPAVRDHGPESLASADSAPEPKRVAWHDTTFMWDNSATTQTLGVGADYQSRDPTYEMLFRLAPRYYFIDQSERDLSLRADIRLLREFTNSDSTTERGEWTFADTDLSLVDVENLRRNPGNRTQLVLRAPALLFPTSKTSALGGRILGLGAGVGVDQEVPLRGKGAAILPGLILRPRVNYFYQFVRSVVATNDRIDRVRLDPDGQSAPSDQLSGAAFPQHLLTVSARADTLITPQLTFGSEFGMRYAYRYAIPQSVDVCGVLATGCAAVPPGEVQPDSGTRWGVSTLFVVSLSYGISDSLELSAGYLNLSPQLGADGRRRSVFYSPDARAFLSLSVALDALYQTALGQRSPSVSHAAGQRHPKF